MLKDQKMYGVMTRPEDTYTPMDEEKRLKEPVTITIKRGTLEAIFREFKGEPCRDAVSEQPLPGDTQERIRENAIADLQNAFEKIDRPTLPRDKNGTPLKKRRRPIPFLDLW